MFNQHSYSSINIGDSVLVFQICNSNSARDDNFNVYLNNVYIGFLDLNYSSLVGSLFQGTSKTNYVIDGDFICPLTLMVNYFFDRSILIEGTNVLFMENAQNNGNNNAGSIGLRHYAISESGDSLINPRVVDDISFSGSSGDDITRYFTYP